MAKMDDSQMRNLIRSLEGDALGYQDGELNYQRAASLDRYLARPYGNEIEGRSQVCTSDVFDAVEGMLPGLVRVFTSGDEVCEFEPVSAEDEAAAKQETEYCNFVLTQKNRFLPFLQTWLRDGLIQKVGYVKAIWEESESTTEERYRGLTEDELAFLVQDPTVEIVEHALDESGISVSLRIKGKQGQVKLYNCPPEEVLVEDEHAEVSLRDCTFVQHRPRKTISQIRAMGYDIPDDISDTDDYTETAPEYIARNLYDSDMDSDESADPSMRVVTFKESYLLCDYDGDGIAERRRVCMVGDLVLANEPWETVPICAWTPLIMPHRHVGRSLAEQVEDVQKVKTTVLRSALDSMYLSLNGRNAISDKVVLDDMLVSRPGGVVRLMDGAMPGEGHIMPLVTPDLSGQAYNMLEYFDAIRETRTGVTRYNQGLDANSLNKTATGIQSIMSAAQQRTELVARTFAETGLRDLLLLVHELIRKNATKPEIVRLRNQWVPIDPRVWKTRYDMTISVGLGTGNREHVMQALMTIAQAQAQALPIGVVKPENVYNTAKKIAEAAGFKNPDLFFTDPSNQPPQEPQPDPKMMESQAKLQIEERKIQADQQKSAADMQIRQAESQQQMQLEQAKLQLEAQRMQFQMDLERAKAEWQAELERMKLLMQADLEREKAMMTQVTATEEKPDMGAVSMAALAAALDKMSAPRHIVRDQNGDIAGIQ